MRDLAIVIRRGIIVLLLLEEELGRRFRPALKITITLLNYRMAFIVDMKVYAGLCRSMLSAWL